MASNISLALIQMRMSADRKENLAMACQRIRDAAGQGAQVIVLPELFTGHYFCQVERLDFFAWAEPIPGPTTQALADLARELGVVIVGSVFERRAAGLCHNTVVVLDADGSTAGIYRKMHIPDDPSYYEKYYFTPGDLGFQAIRTRFLTIGTLICWDQWYPEAARLTAMRGADILVYPTAIGWLPGEKEGNGPPLRNAWQTVQRGHAIANGLYVAAVNRTGFEQPTPDSTGLDFWGGSFACGPFGEILAEAPADAETTLLVQIDPGRIAPTRHAWPFFRDRRIDAYAPITRRFHDTPEQTT